MVSGAGLPTVTGAPALSVADVDAPSTPEDVVQTRSLKHQRRRRSGGSFLTSTSTSHRSPTRRGRYAHTPCSSNLHNIRLDLEPHYQTAHFTTFVYMPETPDDLD
ncbi:MAG: hypothetical protein Q9159_000002 [Coniocarpon cinnabarinum]